MIWGFLRPLVWCRSRFGIAYGYGHGDGDGHGDGYGDGDGHCDGYGWGDDDGHTDDGDGFGCGSYDDND